MKLRTRVEEPSDAPAVRRVHMAAFPGPEEADLVDALRRDPAWLPGLSVVAVDGNELVVAHALLTRLRIGKGKGLALAPVAVAPEWQRRGVGELVVRAALEAAEQAGERLVVVIGAPAYYGRFGFIPAARHAVSGPYEVPEEVFQVLPLSAYDGNPRGRCDYPEPFETVAGGS
ncbi:GNAT family N-acetyltransferase [Kitasatospora kifunensis]|uniref:Putative acetyltransferase n=1 Tax=Kitasatospora kifunensis TaxID=58351 RepID=A0A7W7VYK2_KITKI|nr:N-acetyltransferase [Kitasatospora kifunensis]MBB4926789.1 putative acetyltransferase [Kitasatospora kifunensis]